MVTSSGMRPSSIKRRLKANSVLEADGKPTSISLKPHFTSASKSSSFCDTFIGTASAWLPSRRSTLHQVGAAVRTRSGQRRSGRLTGWNGRYFDAGFFNMAAWFRGVVGPQVAPRVVENKKPHGRVAAAGREASWAFTGPRRPRD